MRDIEIEVLRDGIRMLQQNVAVTWTNEDYSGGFLDDSAPHAAMRHALLHVMKASGKLAATLEIADHLGGPKVEAKNVKKYISDLVICAARLATTCPHGEFDLATALILRLEDIRAKR